MTIDKGDTGDGYDKDEIKRCKIMKTANNTKTFGSYIGGRDKDRERATQRHASTLRKRQ